MRCAVKTPAAVSLWPVPVWTGMLVIPQSAFVLDAVLSVGPVRPLGATSPAFAAAAANIDANACICCILFAANAAYVGSYELRTTSQ